MKHAASFEVLDTDASGRGSASIGAAWVIWITLSVGLWGVIACLLNAF